MKVFRASRRPRAAFDPLDSSASVARRGWRYNDARSEILYAAEREALAILEVAARPGWDTVGELMVAVIEVPDGSVRDLDELGISLPSNWNARPAAPNAQRIAGEFLAAVDREAAARRRVCGVRVPSVISSTDHTVLLDPRQKAAYAVSAWQRIPFDWLLGTAT
ncbi:RES family NAD+ phosphorylase [Pelomonas sp. KK5]|uniref:RES family NAD+ phosphorylase n=1 Tax=Pelomonas sp. KK5 TaxID=1855730 RepID=UPI00097C1E3B|nr:RES family NAD+ phosphorylase [Pelomonas sp. KK5]